MCQVAVWLHHIDPAIYCTLGRVHKSHLLFHHSSLLKQVGRFPDLLHFVSNRQRESPSILLSHTLSSLKLPNRNLPFNSFNHYSLKTVFYFFVAFVQNPSL